MPDEVFKTPLGTKVGLLLHVVDKLGIPTVFLAILAFWARPWVERVLTSHLEFVETSKQRMDNLDEQLHLHDRFAQDAVGRILETVADQNHNLERLIEAFEETR